MRILLVITGLSLLVFYSCQNKHRLLASEHLEIGADDDTAWSIGMRKYTMNFNAYREKNGLPLLPGNYYLFTSGGDYAEWKNPGPEYPCYDEKIVVWYGAGTKEPFLVWENNLFTGKNGETLSFRYGRKNVDSLMMNYMSFDPLYIKEADSLHWRSYRYFGSSTSPAKIIEKEQYDSILHTWGIKL